MTTLQTRSTKLRVFGLGCCAAMFVWDSPDAKPGRLKPFIAGEPLRPPFACLSLPLRGGYARHLMVAAIRPSCSSRSAALLDHQGGEAGARRQGASDPSSIVDFCLDAVLAGTERLACLRVARFLMEVCAGMFGLGGDADFVATCRRMIDTLSPSPGAARSRCQVYPGMIWCETQVPVALGDILSVCFLGQGSVQRINTTPLLSPGPRNRDDIRICRLLLDCRRFAGETITVILFGEGGVACRRLTTSPRHLPPLAELIGQRPAWLRLGRRDLIYALASLSADNPRAALLVREIAALTLSPPSLINQVPTRLAAATEQLQAVDGNLLASGWMTDRFGLVEGIHLESASGRQVTVPLEAITWAAPAQVPPAEDGRRWFLFVTDQQVLADDIGDRCWLSLELRSGSKIEFAEGPDLVDSSTAMAHLTATLASGRYRINHVLKQIEPFATGLRQRSLRDYSNLEIIKMGVAPRRPTTALVIDAGEDQGRLWAVLSLLATDSQIDEIELLIIVRGGMSRARDQVSKLMAAYGLSGTLVIVNDATAVGVAFNRAAAASTAPLLVFLEGNAIPESKDWFGILASLMDGPGRGLVAALPVHPDQSLVGVGINFFSDFYEDWQPKPNLRGFPRDCRRAKSASVVAATAGCCCVRRSMFERTGGFSAGYSTSNGRFIDLCLKVGEAGEEVWQTDAAAVILFDPVAPAADRDPVGDIRRSLDARLLERLWGAHLSERRVPHALADGHGATVSRIASMS